MINGIDWAGDCPESNQDRVPAAITGYRRKAWTIFFGFVEVVSINDLIDTVKPNNFMAERFTMLT
jgi:hypothetical protein